MKAFVFLAILWQGGLGVQVSTEQRGTDPLSGVIKLLTDVGTQIREEGAEEDKQFKSFQCYCDTNKHKVALTLDEDKTSQDRLRAVYREADASNGAKQSEVNEHKQGLEQLQNYITDLRRRREIDHDLFVKQSAAYQDDAKQAQDALQVLMSKVPGALVAKHPGTLNTVNGLEEKDFLVFVETPAHKDSLKKLAKKYLSEEDQQSFADAIDSSGMKPLSFIQQTPPLAIESTDSVIGNYKQIGQGANLSPGVETVIGYLKSMVETAAQESEKIFDNEQENKKQFEDLQASYQTQIAMHQAAMSKKAMQAGEFAVASAQAKGDLDSCNDRIQKAEDFMRELNTTCDTRKRNYDTLVVERNQEQAAVQQALEVLQGVREPTMVNSVRFLFLETGSEIANDPRTKQVAAMLQAKVKGKSVSMLTYMLKKAKVDMRSVLKVIENLIEELHNDQAVDDAHKAQCKLDMDRTVSEEAEIQDAVSRMKAFMAAEETAIADHQDTITLLKQQNKDLEDEGADAKAARAKEEKAYNKALNAATDNKRVVDHAAAILRSVYEEATSEVQEDEWSVDDAPSFVQVHERLQVEQAPATPGAHKANKGGFKAIAILLELSRKMQAEATTLTADESDAVRSFSRVVEQNKKQMTANVEAITQKEFAITDGKRRMQEFKAEKRQKDQQLKEAMDLADTINKECDTFLNGRPVSGYKKRAQLRRDDLDGLKSAMAILNSRR